MIENTFLGGKFGFGFFGNTSTFSAEVILNRNEFLPGELINVNLKCDNS